MVPVAYPAIMARIHPFAKSILIVSLGIVRPSAARDDRNRRVLDGLPHMAGVRIKIREKELGWPLAITAAVAVFSVAAFLIVEFGPWNRQPHDREATQEAAQSAGAKVIPTQRKLAVEPTPAGPKPIKPEAPAARN